MNEIKKIYYSIREVSEQTEVEPHVLRFWEKEFSMLRPKRGKSRSRAYRERDIKIILAIKDLLYKQKYTIQGAAERLKKDRSLWEDLALEEAKQAASILGYNYQGGKWYERSYKVFNKKYKLRKAKKQKELGLIRRKIKSLFE